MILDIALFLVLGVLSQPAWTGIGLHEWLAGLVGVAVIFHVVINWDWVMHAAVRLLGKLKTVSRANFVVDVVLFLATVTVMLSGVMLLPGVISLHRADVVRGVWLSAHALSSNVILVTMLIHLMLHVRWMAETIERHALSRPGRHSVGWNKRLTRGEGQP